MNPAERTLKLYDRLVSKQQDQSMTQTWAVVFDLANEDPNLEDKVVKCLVALRQQIDYSRRKLSEREMSIDLTSPGFERLKNAASSSNLNTAWNGIRGNVQPPENRHTFMWSTWVLRDLVESEISAEDLSELLIEIEELEKTIAIIEMSSTLRNFIMQ